MSPQAEHRRHTGLNNRAQNSHQPTRRREWARRRFRSPTHTQWFLEPFGPIRRHFCPGRALFRAPAYRRLLAERYAGWDELTGVAACSQTHACRRSCRQVPTSFSSYVTVTIPFGACPAIVAGSREVKRPPCIPQADVVAHHLHPHPTHLYGAILLLWSPRVRNQRPRRFVGEAGKAMESPARRWQRCQIEGGGA